MFQIIQKINSISADKTAVSLLYLNYSIVFSYFFNIQSDVSFVEDLVKLDSKGKIFFYPIVENPEHSNWDYGVGQLTEEMIKNYMPDPYGNYKK